MRKLALALLLVLPACAGTTDYRQAVAESCSSYARALVTLADARAAGKLDAADVKQVDAARLLADPICTNQTGLTADAALVERLRAPINTLITIAAGV